MESLSSIGGQSLSKFASDANFAARFNVELNRSHEEGVFQLVVSYTGHGTKAENYMVNLLTTNIARDFLASPWAAIGTGNIKAPIDTSPSNGSPSDLSSDELVAKSTELTNRAFGMIDQIDSTQHSTRETNAGEIADDNSDQKFPTTSASPFMNAGYTTKPNASPTGKPFPTTELRQTVDQLSTLVKDANAIGTSEGAVAFSVRSVSGRSAGPIGGVPRSPILFLFVMSSALIAFAVSVAYRPFSEKGFESVDSLKEKLGVPVIATINTKGTLSENAANDESHESWANKTVHFSELALFAITLVVLGFCIVNQDIRLAFSENIYHGFSKIFWMFNS